jgi:hypothetical protein
LNGCKNFWEKHALEPFNESNELYNCFLFFYIFPVFCICTTKKIWLFICITLIGVPRGEDSGSAEEAGGAGEECSGKDRNQGIKHSLRSGANLIVAFH